MLIPGKQLDRVASGDLSLFKDCKVEASPTTAQESLYHFRTTEADAELETRHSRLGDDKLRRPNPKEVADVNGFLKQALRCEVLPECPQR